MRARLRVFATHLGLRPSERREQVRRVLAAVERERPHPTLLMGDLNEFVGQAAALAAFAFPRNSAGARTFPARRPVFALDRIWVAPAGSLRSLARHASPARAGSIGSPATHRRSRRVTLREPFDVELYMSQP